MAIESGAERAPTTRRRPTSVTRRAVLGAAVVGGAGVAVSRLLGLKVENYIHPGQSLAGRTNWISPLGEETAQVAQLLRRGAFGATQAELERALSDGYTKTVSRFIETPGATPPPLPGGDDATRSAPLKLVQLQKWWLDHLLASPTPFAERMTLFWHGHFTSDYRKVGLQSPFVYWQNQTWRANALGDLRSFLYQVTIDPAMLRYLDLGTSTGRSPNENYSRELMELFTMGPGNFTETDVREAAKALAGWREPRTEAMVTADRSDPRLTAAQQAKVNPAFDSGRTGLLDPKRAFAGPITFLGRTGTMDVKAVLDRILSQKATATHIVRRVLMHFVMPNPPDATVNRIAEGFVRSKWSIRQLMHDVLTSDEFRAPSTYRSLVKEPVEYMVSALRALGARAQTAMVVQLGSSMGQVLLDPPDVGGWPLNESWISSNTVIARVNFATQLLTAMKTAIPSAANAHQLHLDSVLSPSTARLLNAATTDHDRWAIVLASPEFQLK